MRRLISSGSRFESEIGYSRAVAVDGWVFVAGTTGYDYATMQIPDRVEDQCRSALATIAKALGEAGANLTDVVRVRYILTDATLWPACWPIVSARLRRSASGRNDDGRGPARSADEDRNRGNRLSLDRSVIARVRILPPAAILFRNRGLSNEGWVAFGFLVSTSGNMILTITSAGESILVGFHQGNRTDLRRDHGSGMTDVTVSARGSPKVAFDNVTCGFASLALALAWRRCRRRSVPEHGADRPRHARPAAEQRLSGWTFRVVSGIWCLEPCEI